MIYIGTLTQTPNLDKDCSSLQLSATQASFLSLIFFFLLWVSLALFIKNSPTLISNDTNTIKSNGENFHLIFKD